MNKKFILGICGGVVLMISGAIFLFNYGQRPSEEKKSESEVASRETEHEIKKEIPRHRNKGLSRSVTSSGAESRETADKTVAEDELSAGDAESMPVRHPRFVEEIKKQIYERKIESVDRIHLLDELVQTGDMDTRQLWGDGWTSADDWKKDSNGFRLEKDDDGAMVFSPDEATAAKYTFFENPLSYEYDEVNKEFVNNIDYYGKTIYNVAKFINDDVLVMMTISGTKVDLNIYQKNANQE